MQTIDAVQHYGSKAAVARILGLTRQAVSHWGDQPPMLAQYRLEELSGGKLKRAVAPLDSDGKASLHKEQDGDLSSTGNP